jgi:hypothetical protein
VVDCHQDQRKPFQRLDVPARQRKAWWRRAPFYAAIQRDLTGMARPIPIAGDKGCAFFRVLSLCGILRKA